LKLVDQTTLKAVEAWHPLGFEIAGSVLIMQLDENLHRCQEALEVCKSFDLIDGVFSEESCRYCRFNPCTQNGISSTGTYGRYLA